MTHVLLVEDDTLLAREQSRQLETAGFSVQHVAHAGAALVAIDEQLPQVIIVDMLLPVTSGLSLLHELQSYEDTATIPIVVCTSLADTLSLEELAPYGVRRLLDKTTMQPEDIVTAVRAVRL